MFRVCSVSKSECSVSGSERRAQFYSVSKSGEGLSTKTERESQVVV